MRGSGKRPTPGVYLLGVAITMLDKRTALPPGNIRKQRSRFQNWAPSPILAEEVVIGNARTAEFRTTPGDNEQLERWLESP